ncbi:MAG: ABC transporter, substrate-binding protein (cluster 3, basic aa/glutamine/opines) [uncultured Nocardioidaceae bacterium]|uniref:ABC transporter, substrate-binding protein (Cluster 3, basic aa/glutamine/opines) n=1 Tax=uncultured Nocardioidaceae bacterium TaxID=253824 RepID=A0A6J4KV29_9ACTN|nr:MAG: ABC transporter, substrate-binding protein (cluster 3, basic aa/glutamine/opines) [uncultured Nocardioidaceae bacterium]
MTTRSTRSLLAGAGLALAVSLTGCGSDPETPDTGTGSGSGLQTLEEGTLKVCSDIPYAPFDILEGDTFTGFDGDLVNEIATGLDLELVVQDSGFDSLQSGLALNSGQCDMAASAMTITPEREENLDFTEGYYDSEQSLLVPSGSDVASIDDLTGKRVGVQQGTTGKTFTEENAPDDAEIVSFPSDAEMFNAIKAGQVDALLQDLPVNIAHAEDGDFEIVEKFDTGEQYGFAVKQDNTALVEAIDGELTRMRDDGTYDKIYDSYFATD